MKVTELLPCPWCASDKVEILTLPKFWEFLPGDKELGRAIQLKKAFCMDCHGTSGAYFKNDEIKIRWNLRYGVNELNSTELLDCPFCGAMAYIDKDFNKENWITNIICCDCRASIPFWNTDADTFAAWNKREGVEFEY